MLTLAECIKRIASDHRILVSELISQLNEVDSGERPFVVLYYWEVSNILDLIRNPEAAKFFQEKTYFKFS